MPATPTSTPGPIRVFDIDLDRFDDERVAGLFELLDEAERQRAWRMATPLLHRRFVAAHAATRMLLAKQLGVEPDVLRLGKGANGKPVLAGPLAHALHFNLSHCGGRALLAVCGDEVGIDIEGQVRGDIDALAADVLAPEELNRFQALPVADRSMELCRLWAAKEALLKACGLGLGLAPASFRIQADGCWHRLPPPADPGPWWLQQLRIQGPFRAYVATRRQLKVSVEQYR